MADMDRKGALGCARSEKSGMFIFLPTVEDERELSAVERLSALQPIMVKATFLKDALVEAGGLHKKGMLWTKIAEF